MAGNDNFDQILSTTLKNYIPKLTDNIFSARPLLRADQWTDHSAH